MRRNSFSLSHHGRTIAGEEYAPEGERFPVVVMCHGLNGQGLDFCKTARFFAENGIGAVTFDFCGGGVHDKSGFPSREMTLFTEKEDLHVVLDFVRQKSCGKLFLFGGSQGGAVAALEAEERKDLSGLILLYPAFCIPDHWRRAFGEGEIPESVEIFGLSLGRKYFEEIKTLDFFSSIGKFSSPVLILHGTEDPLVPYSDSERACKIYPRAETVLFEGEKHGFTAEGNARAARLSLEFMRKLF